MRCHKETLLAFLDIFVQDPITDTIWYKRAPDLFDRFKEDDPKDGTLQRAIVRVKDKLNGTKFGGIMNEKEQVVRLIDLATSELRCSTARRAASRATLRRSSSCARPSPARR
jgi:hypothetical protein